MEPADGDRRDGSPPPQVTHAVERASTNEGLPIAPSLGPALDLVDAPRQLAAVDGRVILVCALSMAIAIAAGLVAQVLTRLIGLITNLCFHGTFSTSFASPAGHHLGPWVIAVPVAGAILVGLMARYGSKAIRGHGIPEAMEQVLFNQSRIPARITFLKPLSAAVSIGTGGPFGAEGPIIATGGALGSLVGQLLRVTAHERKTLLAAGAAAGMAATFGSPVSAVLLAIELLLFEYRPRSVIPVSLACATATGVRYAFVGAEPVFPMPQLTQPSGAALVSYIVLGLLVGVASVYVTKAVYAVEDAFEKLPIHWMWWPAIGAVAVGVIGYFAPHTMGVGYDNIEKIVEGDLLGSALAIFCALKFVSWVISLGSGTSGGTLAPLFTVGGGLGSLIGLACVTVAPRLGVDVRVAALVGMAAIFAGASRALLASVVFAFETTRQPLGLLPLLGGCGAAYLVSCLMMENSIMTEKLARRGARIPAEYAADFLDQVLVRDRAITQPLVLAAERTLGDVRAWLLSNEEGSHHVGYPIVDGDRLLGLLTRRELLAAGAATPDAPTKSALRRKPVVIFEDSSLREAADQMVRADVGRLLVVKREQPTRLVGLVTRQDLLSAHGKRLAEDHRAEPRYGLLGKRPVEEEGRDTEPRTA